MAATHTEHRCHAEGCEDTCPSDHLMCRRHWGLIPYKLRLSLGSIYRPGGDVALRLTEEYTAAARAAILAVAELERQPPKPKRGTVGTASTTG